MLARIIVAAAVVAVTLFPAGCATRPPGVAAQPSPTLEGERLVVPQLTAIAAAEADQLLTKAGMIPILRYEPGVVADMGTVISTEPPVGSLIPAGGTVTVFVAGRPGDTLHEHVDAHRETFVGVGMDAGGVMVVAIVASADLAKEMAALSTLAKGEPFRVQTCPRSWIDLKRVQVDLSKRKFLPGAEKLVFATAVDPLACAVRMTIDLPDAQVAELTARYQGALVIQTGSVGRGG